MDNFSLDKFLVEHNLTKNSVRLTESMNKDLRSFTKEIKSQLKEQGFDVTLFKEATIPAEVRKEIHMNPTQAAIMLQEKQGSVERVEVLVNESQVNTLTKLVQKYNTPEGTYGPEKLNEWFDSHVNYARPGGVYRSKISKVNVTQNVVQVTYNRRKDQ